MFLTTGSLIRIGAGTLLPILGKPYLAFLVAAEMTVNPRGDDIFKNSLMYFAGFAVSVEAMDAGLI